MNTELITVKELCEILGIGSTLAYRMLKLKEIPSTKIGNKIVIRKEDVEKYIRKKIGI